MGRDVFAYGSLQVTEVMTAVTGKYFPSVPARLPAHARYRLKERAYPGLAPQPGRLHCGVDRLSLSWLDRFEDRFYERRTLVFTGEGGYSPRL